MYALLSDFMSFILTIQHHIGIPTQICQFKGTDKSARMLSDMLRTEDAFAPRLNNPSELRVKGIAQAIPQHIKTEYNKYYGDPGSKG